MPALSIIVPTYNERDNVQSLYQGISQALDDFEIIFVDDSSPDGTAQAIKTLQARDRRIKLLERPGKLGLATAIMDGLGLAEGQFAGMMDADLSHQPEALPRMLAAFSDADIVIGSRYVRGGRIVGWPLRRHITSRVAVFISHILLHPPVKDTTSGFVLYRRDILAKLKGQLNTRGYKLLLEVLVKCPEARVREIPIVFTNRVRGQSKLNQGEVVEFLKLCWKLRKYRVSDGLRPS